MLNWKNFKKFKKILPGFFAVACLASVGCSASQANAPRGALTAKDEARYGAAIEKGDAIHPPAVQQGDTLVIDAARGQVDIIRTVNVETSGSAAPEKEKQQTPVTPQRVFHVDAAAYDAFFEQSPASVLARVALEPVQDGAQLLGYRIVKIRTPMDGVDIRSGDVVIGINGVVPRTPDDYFAQWQKSKTSGKCALNLQRESARFEIVWEK